MRQKFDNGIFVFNPMTKTPFICQTSRHHHFDQRVRNVRVWISMVIVSECRSLADLSFALHFYRFARAKRKEAQRIESDLKSRALWVQRKCCKHLLSISFFLFVATTAAYPTQKLFAAPFSVYNSQKLREKHHLQ